MMILKKMKLYRFVRKIYKKYTFTKRNRGIDQQMLDLGITLSLEHLERCKVYPNRKAMISDFPSNATIAEVGVAEGNFSAVILLTTSPKLFYLIDAWAMDKHSHYGESGFKEVNKRFAKEIKDEIIQVKRGWSHEILEQLEDNLFDWIYIDAAHDYQSVYIDLNLALNKVKNGGIISGHDYLRWGNRGMRFGVLEAVNRFCVGKELSFIGISLDHNDNWSYALRVNK